MKHFLKPFLLSCSLVCLLNLEAGKSNYNEYHGILLAAETLPSLIPTPQYLQDAFEKWILNTKNQEGLTLLDLINTLNQKTSVSKLQQTEKNNNTLLESFNIKQLSRWTYVFSFGPHESYLIKLSGPRLKINNVLAENNTYHWSYEQLPTEEENKKRLQDMEELCEQSSTLATFQHISRIPHWLKLREGKYHFLRIPDEVYLLHIPGKPRAVCDDNYVVLEKNIGTLTSIKNEFSEEQLEWYVEDNSIEEMVDASIHGALWDLHSNVSIISKKPDSTKCPPKLLCLSDFEQPDNSKSSDFYYKNKNKYESDVACGLKEFARLMIKSPKHLEKTVRTIETHPVFAQFSNYKATMEELNKLLLPKS